MDSKARKFTLINYTYVGDPSYEYVPEHATLGASGADLRNASGKVIVIHPQQVEIVPTGICVEIPEGYEGQLRPRSGISVKRKLMMVNSIGTIDSDYRGEIGVPFFNPTNDMIYIDPNERIAQLVVTQYERCHYLYKAELSETIRGEGGFGHTGT